jgi:hypothetical protein
VKTLGWREWVTLPDLGIDRIKAKVDTGARTSALHAFELVTEKSDGGLWAVFGVHPLQNDTEHVVRCRSPIKDRRLVRDSGGHEEERFVIETTIRLAGMEWPIEMTLTDRDDMGFRMLLGRTATRGRFQVDPARSYVASRRRRKKRKLV